MGAVGAAPIIAEGVGCYEGDNLHSVEHAEGNTVVKIGRKTLREVLATQNIE